MRIFESSNVVLHCTSQELSERIYSGHLVVRIKGGTTNYRKYEATPSPRGGPSGGPVLYRECPSVGNGLSSGMDYYRKWTMGLDYYRKLTIIGNGLL